jgi:hypothetical protein
VVGRRERVRPTTRGEVTGSRTGAHAHARGRRFTGTEYVDSIRGDLNERLSRLGIE